MVDSHNFCPRCGTAVIAGARFCARCGYDFAAAPVTAPAEMPQESAQAPHDDTLPRPAPRSSAAKSGLLLVALGLLLVVIVFTFWMMRPRRATSVVTDSAAEQAFPEPTERSGRERPPSPIVEAPPGRPSETIEIIEEPQPLPQPEAQPLPRPETQPQPRPTTPEVKVSEGEAVGRVMSYIRSTDYYEIPTTCYEARSLGYENVGYTVEIRGTCPDIRNEGRLLGRWRVDAMNGEVFVQKPDGLFLKP